MSTIDRAIQKLEGGSAEEIVSEEKSEELEQKTETPELKPETPELKPETPELKPEMPELADQANPTPAPAEPLAPKPEPVKVEPIAEQQPMEAVATQTELTEPSEPIQAKSTGQGANYVAIDFERLSAAGFMIPGMPDNHMTEEYQAIKRRLLGNMVEGITQTNAPSNLIMVTSSVPGEGKTFTTVNLAISMAKEMDRTVLAVDTDIIKSDMSRLLEVEDKKGLFDLLSDDSIDLSDLLVKTNIPNLTVLPAGHEQGGISEKLASEAMFKLVNELSQRYSDRVIIFDCPPVLATSGAAALAPYIGQIVMVAEAVKTPQGIIKHAMRSLEHVKVTGMILNKSRLNHPISDYQYGYYYQQQKKS